MIPWLLQKVFGTKHERELKKIHPMVARINELEPKMRERSDEELRALTAKYKERLGNGEPLDSLLPRPSRPAARPGGACSTCATSTCSSSAASPCTAGDRGDEDRRGQDARVDAARVPQRPGGQRGAHRHGQRLPRHARRRVDGAHPPLSRALEGAPWSTRRATGRRRPRTARHHLRAEQRVRLRLPARQHEVLASTTARSETCTTPSSTRSTRSSSTRRARRSSSPGPGRARRSSTAR
jgi:hypothetical protein